MDRVFSVDEEMSEHLWSPEQPKMNKSSSEWAFQRFLQEAEEAATTTDRDEQDKGNDGMKSHDRGDTNNHKRGPPQHRPPKDSGDYQGFLKSQLDLACAAVALSRSANSKPQDSTPTPSNELDREGGRGPVQLPSEPAASSNHFVQVKSATSDSSGDQSDEDEVEGESEITDPTDAKRVRRMLSNRESARRSRRRKQAHLTELETQVGQLRVENSSLHKRLTGISQKYNEAAVDNRVLKADVETLRAKVKMAEETVKRVSGLNPLFQAMSEISSTMAMPSFASNSSDSSADAAVPAQDGHNQKYYHRQSNTNNNNNSTNSSRLSAENHRIQENMQGNGSANKMGRRVSMQRVASLEHLQKRIRREASSLATHGSRDK